MSAPTCPECGATMRPWGLGATPRKHIREWMCPVNEAEVTRDEDGRFHRQPDSKHKCLRVWLEDELQVR